MNQAPGNNWWDRNWKWFVPVGCLGITLIAVGCIALLLFIVFGMMKSSDVYKEAIVSATTTPAVQVALGAPIEPGFFITGNISINNSSGAADLAIPISGPIGSGTIYLKAEKIKGKWVYDSLVVEIDGSQEKINLLLSSGNNQN